VSTGTSPNPWKPLTDGSTPIWDALITDWLTTHHQQYPGEPAVAQRPKAKPVGTPMLDQAVREQAERSAPKASE
jgi:hypothetical protein